MSASTNVHVEVDRGDLAKCRIATEETAPLADGQVRLRIDRFALTANNVSYAVAGDRLDYWDFFPAEAGWGRIPAMGWGELVESKHKDLEVGERYFGWFPMSKLLTLDAGSRPDGLVDQGEHRAGHAAVYRTYTAARRDPFYDPDREDEHALLRGLFITSFLAEDFFFSRDYFGAGTSIVLSASSKTAIGFAGQAAARGRGPVVGVTSAGNVGFVESLGCYDRVVAYDQLQEIPTEQDALLVDLSGNGEVVRGVHEHLGSRLRYSMAVGVSHWQADRAAGDLPGPRPTFFFAPTQAKKRHEEWGPAGYAERLATALARFVEGSGTWLDIDRRTGPEAVKAVYLELLEGKVPPHLGKIVSLHEGDS